MSAPTGGSSRLVTVEDGAGAALLTEYAPGPDDDDTLTIINLGTERVWLSNDSMLASGRGVPLEGGTSVPWAAGGTIFVVPDAANVTDVQLILTSAVTDYQPSPYALAAYAAARIAAAGVPINQQFVALYSSTGPIGAGIDTTVLDTGSSQSVTIALAPNGPDVPGTLYYLTATWSDDAAGTKVTAIDGFSIGSNVEGQTPVIARLIVNGRYLRVQVFTSGVPTPVVTLRVGGDSQNTARNALYLGGVNIQPNYLISAPTLYSTTASTSAIAAGGTAKLVPIGPAASKVLVSLATSAAAGKVVFALWSRPLNSPALVPDTQLGQFSNAAGGNVPTFAEFDVPFGCSLYAVVTNNDTVSRAPTTVVIDVSPR